MDINNVTLVGRVTKDPVLRQVGETQVCDLSIAMNRKYSGKEETTFVDVTFWGKDAATASEYCKKGRTVGVVGRLTLDKWEKDGQNFSKLKVTGESLMLIGGPNENGAARTEKPTTSKKKAEASDNEDIF